MRPAFSIGLLSCVSLLLVLALVSGCLENPLAKQRADELAGGEKGVEVKVECVADKDCDDQTPSTKDHCSFDGKCEHLAIKDCVTGDGYCPAGCTGGGDSDCGIDKCQSNADCDDKRAETKDECAGTPKRCSNAKIKGCISGDGFCPSGCNALSDTDCRNLPAEAKACKTDTDCEDEDAATADACVGEPPHCTHVVVKNCVDGDGICPAICDDKTDSDCQDKCAENGDCNDGNANTLDRCEGRPKKCKNVLVTECKGGDGFCPDACNDSTDSDCACRGGDGFCPRTCDFRTDEDCPKKNLCEGERDCDDHLKYTLDACEGKPKTCTHVFIEGSGCGALNADLNDLTDAASCFCMGYNACAKLGLVVDSNRGTNEFAYSVTDLDTDNCRVVVYPKRLEGKELDPRLNYTSVCGTLDSGAPEVIGALRGGEALTGDACGKQAAKFFGSFPDALLISAANCRGNFTEYYSERKAKAGQ